MSYDQSNGGASALAYAEATFMGKPYVFGGDYPPLGNSPGTDCSGLVQNSYDHVGVSLPRTTETQCLVAQISLSEPRLPGDCLFFTGAPSDPPPGHVGIYVGVGAMGPSQHEFLANPRGAAVMFNAPYTGDPFGIRYDYVGSVGPVLYVTRPSILLPKPPAPTPPPPKPKPIIQEDESVFIASYKGGDALFYPMTLTCRGIPDPATLAFYRDAVGIKVLTPPAGEVARYTQVG